MVVGKPNVQLMPNDTASPNGMCMSLAQTNPISTVPATPQTAASTSGGNTEITCCGVVVARLEKIRIVTKNVIRLPACVLARMPFSKNPSARNTAPMIRHMTK